MKSSESRTAICAARPIDEICCIDQSYLTNFFMSTNQRLLVSRDNQSGHAVVLCQPIRKKYLPINEFVLFGRA